jgi:hypothetical protein
VVETGEIRIMKTLLRGGPVVLACALAGDACADRVDLVLGGQSIMLDSGGRFEAARLTLVGPGELLLQMTLPPGHAGGFRVPAQALFDGDYRYRIDFDVIGAHDHPRADVGDREGRAVGARMDRPAPAPLGGSFALRGGRLYASPRVSIAPDSTERTKDVVVADDQIVQGSLCAGLDCVDGESFGTDTIRLKQNNLVVHFDDTSTGPGFAANDWRIGINDATAGGASKFFVEDVTAARIPFTVMAGSPTNTLFVSEAGNVGIGTSMPTLDLGITTTDTPAVRLEQTSGGGFIAQTWDIGANEANFFVRDLTAGSRLSFRIRPGAPTSSIDIAASGSVGIGTANPQARLDVTLETPAASPTTMLAVRNPSYPDGSQETRFQVDSNGNVEARGTISQLSSRSAKHAFGIIDGEALLQRVRALPVMTWSYLSEADRHVGPVAEDFHAAFGLGASDRMIAPADLAGVALAAVKALQQDVDERDRRIEALERRLADVESRLPQ